MTIHKMDETQKRVFYILLTANTIIWLPFLMGAWDKDKPSSSTSLRNSNPEILANWSELESALSQDHTFAAGSPDGKHTQITYTDPISTPSNVTSEGVTYTKDVSAVVEFHWKDESGNELQMTSGGDLYSSAGLTVTTASTFNGSITLGAGDDLIGSSTSDITMNTNKFTVAGASGNTVVGGTLDVTGNIDPTTYETTNGGFLDEDDMTSDAADNVASQQSIRAFGEGGGYPTVDGTRTAVFTKYFTGTLSAGTSTTVAHGVSSALTKILAVTVAASNDSGFTDIKIASFSNTNALTSEFRYEFDATNVTIAEQGTSMQGGTGVYRIKVEYIL